jgi:hypothetical protein
MGDVENMGFYRLNAFIDDIPMGDSSWAEYVKYGWAPPSFYLSEGCVGYLKSDIHLLRKHNQLYKRLRRNQQWEDIKKMMLERHPD